MSLRLPKLQVGQPVRYEALTLFPLFAETSGEIAYRLGDEALADQSVLVSEVSQSGSVPELMVENKGDLRVLFLEGEELVGAKQNRILNTSVLVPAHQKIVIPVSCVERRRWRHDSAYFGASGSHSPSKLRRALKASVSRSVADSGRHTSDQMAVWREVDSIHESLSVESATRAMSDSFTSYHSQIEAYKDRLPYVEGASGLAIALGDQVTSIDLFDQPSTCRKVWKRLLSGMVLDALQTPKPNQPVSDTEVARMLALTNELCWEPTPVVGEGLEYRAKSVRGDYATALVFEGTLIHGSVVAAAV